MKREINLRTKDFKLKRDVVRTFLLWGFFSVILMLTFAYVLFDYVSHHHEIKTELVLLQEENLNLKEKTVLLREMENDISVIKEKVAQLNYLYKKNVPWKQYLGFIFETGEDFVEISQISGCSDGSLKVEGRAGSMEDIIIFKEKLLSERTITETNIENIEYRKVKSENNNAVLSALEESYYLFSVDIVFSELL